MKKREIVIGERKGIVTVIGDGGKVNGLRFIKIKCDCGIEKITNMYNFYKGDVKSCGCQKYKIKHGLHKSRQYNIYGHMKNRCYCETNDKYNYYGERGITICDEWLGENGFINFYNWAMENGYSETLTIDRVDNDRGYSPDNCRWADKQLQAINQRKKSHNTSGYIGIYFDNTSKSWRPSIGEKRLKRHKTLKSAVEARNKYILENNLPHKIQEYKE